MVHLGPRAIAATRKTPERLFEHDEFIRDDTTAELLAALPAQPGTTQMTAANSTPLTDGASAIVLTSGQRAAELGIEPIARVVSSAVYGIDPLVMGLAPASAIPLAISRAGLTPEQIDVWEVHEAFSAQALGVLRELPNQLGGFIIPDDKLTPNGGVAAHNEALAADIEVRGIRIVADEFADRLFAPGRSHRSPDLKTRVRPRRRVRPIR
jgi:acetyl-CoA acetyltransferase